ncbi:oligopeptide:H+ symporter [Tatumella sp. OPLPL6]|uniref:peptide MFS transporter n=1 Tax=Tatumella sp. OPLPL6 TaxID=1928657 RepID=UPI000C52A4B3|nr:oligopeptide:H+ symporter [Tatumella sp. OPLPL6]PIJ46454.1 MFS transporter [Tatumella sp. OPLPL6]
MDVTLEKQNKIAGANILCFIQMFSTMGFAVLYSSLVLYATKKLGFSEYSANAIMGIFGAFNYGLHLFGGYLGGRFLSNRNLFVLGMVLQVIGCYLLSSAQIDGLYWGLALFLTGSGLNVTCINMMLTQRFTPNDPRRESAFLWNYAGMNLGFFMGFTAAGYFQLSLDYHALFLFATLGNLIAIVLTGIFWRHLADRNTPLSQASGPKMRQRLAIGCVILLLLLPVVKVMLTHSEVSSYFVLGLGTLVLVALCIITGRHKIAAERSRMVAYLILTLGSLVFWSLYQLAPMGLMLFAENNLNLQLFGWHIAPQWIQDINTLVIVLGGPLLALLFKRLRAQGITIDIPSQFAASLLFMGAGMLVLPIGIGLAGANGLVDFQWIFWSYLLQSIGELLISSIGYAMIGRLAPQQYQGLLMGTWMMISGIASILAGYLSQAMPTGQGSTPLLTNPGYSHLFTLLAIASGLTAVVLMLLIPLLRRLIGPVQAN